MVGNLFWGMQFRTCKDFWTSTDSSLVESPKILTNTKATPPLLRLFFVLICHSEPKAKNLKRNIFRFCDSQNLVKNYIKNPLKSFCFVWLSQKVESPLPLNLNPPSNANSQNLA